MAGIQVEGLSIDKCLIALAQASPLYFFSPIGLIIISWREHLTQPEDDVLILTQWHIRIYSGGQAHWLESVTGQKTSRFNCS